MKRSRPWQNAEAKESDNNTQANEDDVSQVVLSSRRIDRMVYRDEVCLAMTVHSNI